ncbi:cryptochrome/photolyase family protein [Halobium salinum]|uniref:Cryptochrome/photolyase family protein n=1 Tax=Halobium salinum TaxID=1364940 RepID=A0ABD5PDV6_9EURY|nr:deoxyribodipyrimidine photo-lyase [Halobium salinum]
MQIHWHRRDLRVDDNLALHDAATAVGGGETDESDGDESGADEADGGGDSDEHGDGGDIEGVLPVFVFDPGVLEFASPPRVRFLLDALAELRAAYRERGSELLVRQGDPSTVIPNVAYEYEADRVVWNHDYSGLAQERDEAVRAALDEQDTAHEEFHDAIHHEPGSITTNEGKYYSVYTYFWKKWRDREKAAPVDAPDGSALVAAEHVDDEDRGLPSIGDLGFDEPEADVPTAGTEAARDRLESFCDGPIYSYEEDREYPAREGTSRLSTDLKYGTLGIREVYEATAEAREGAGGEEDESAEEFQSQLAWREFYTHVLHFNPEVVTENFKEYANPIGWREPGDDLEAWKAGETGYPIVDAGMRQLREEAYMHNRLRMVVASFLTKDLILDWRHGYEHFRERLADHDTSNDNGGWQWAASTGTDAQPYFRVFNPMTQGERYDPDAAFIREYVPELEGVDADTIHSWHELDEDEREDAAPDYPAPIVDHSERREEAIETFEAARGDD